MRLYKKGGSVHTVLATTEFVGLSCTRNALRRSWCTVSLVVTKPPTYCPSLTLLKQSNFSSIERDQKKIQIQPVRDPVHRPALCSSPWRWWRWWRWDGEENTVDENN